MQYASPKNTMLPGLSSARRCLCSIIFPLICEYDTRQSLKAQDKKLVTTELKLVGLELQPLSKRAAYSGFVAFASYGGLTLKKQ
jgi:hypothetical protein